jgi:hypothetical protein
MRMVAKLDNFIEYILILTVLLMDKLTKAYINCRISLIGSSSTNKMLEQLIIVFDRFIIQLHNQLICFEID